MSEEDKSIRFDYLNGMDADILKALRETLNLSIETMANILGCDKELVELVENTDYFAKRGHLRLLYFMVLNRMGVEKITTYKIPYFKPNELEDKRRAHQLTYVNVGCALRINPYTIKKYETDNVDRHNEIPYKLYCEFIDELDKGIITVAYDENGEEYIKHE